MSRSEHKRAYEKKYRETHKEQIKQYRQEHKYKEKIKKWRQEHKQHLYNYNKNYRKEHKEHCTNWRLNYGYNPTASIYSITYKNMIYIGSTTLNPKLRWNNHRCYSRMEKYKNKLYSTIREIGIDYFKFNILVEVDKSLVKETEQYYLDLYRVEGKEILNSNNIIKKRAKEQT